MRRIAIQQDKPMDHYTDPDKQLFDDEKLKAEVNGCALTLYGAFSLGRAVSEKELEKYKNVLEMYKEEVADAHKELVLKDSWVKHHQSTVEISLEKQHELEHKVKCLQAEILLNKPLYSRRQLEVRIQEAEKAMEALVTMNQRDLVLAYQEKYKDKK